MSESQKQCDDSTIIQSVDSFIRAVKIRMTAKNDCGFILMITNRGFEFYGQENSGGTLGGIPIVKSPEQIFEWIRNETPEGGRKRFEEKTGLKKIALRSQRGW